MQHYPGDQLPLPPAPAGQLPPVSMDKLPPGPLPPRPVDVSSAADEPRGCLFALSQPPLILFLGVIGGILLLSAVHDLLLL
ncbi:hypothetical protein [Streptomyces alkaliterrae]|uniref:Uncharacterized protein n=2 Tax=Streptomyces alkaliterrae TaxID=2213162 RepID=A0A7W3WXX1_9ACTN|nr:hypothetical protein [Streptomyces alkaliterrae]MBB1260504.1 hypothetical protein [Streptomyces alkaliterrae]